MENDRRNFGNKYDSMFRMEKDAGAVGKGAVFLNNLFRHSGSAVKGARAVSRSVPESGGALVPVQAPAAGRDLFGKAVDFTEDAARKVYGLAKDFVLWAPRKLFGSSKPPVEAAKAAVKGSSWGRKALKGAGLAAAVGGSVAAYNALGDGTAGSKAEGQSFGQPVPVSAAENLGKKFGHPDLTPAAAAPAPSPSYATPYTPYADSRLRETAVREPSPAPSRKYDAGTGEYDGWKIPEHVAPEVWPDKPLHRGGRFQEYDENVNELRRRMSKGEKIPMRLRNNLSMNNPFIGTDG